MMSRMMSMAIESGDGWMGGYLNSGGPGLQQSEQVAGEGSSECGEEDSAPKGSNVLRPVGLSHVLYVISATEGRVEHEGMGAH